MSSQETTVLEHATTTQLYRTVNAVEPQQMLLDTDLIESNYQKYLSIAHAITRNWHDAEDAVQHAVQVALSQDDEKRLQIRNGDAWMVRTVANCSKLLIRTEIRLRKRHQAAQPTIGLLEQDDMENDQEIHLVNKSLSELPEKYQEVVRLHYMHGLKLADVATALARKEETVKKQAQRGMKRLREIVTHRGMQMGSAALLLSLQSLSAASRPEKIPERIVSDLRDFSKGVKPTAVQSPNAWFAVNKAMLSLTVLSTTAVAFVALYVLSSNSGEEQASHSGVIPEAVHELHVKNTQARVVTFTPTADESADLAQVKVAEQNQTQIGILIDGASLRTAHIRGWGLDGPTYEEEVTWENTTGTAGETLYALQSQTDTRMAVLHLDYQFDYVDYEVSFDFRLRKELVDLNFLQFGGGSHVITPNIRWRDMSINRDIYNKLVQLNTWSQVRMQYTMENYGEELELVRVLRIFINDEEYLSRVYFVPAEAKFWHVYGWGLDAEIKNMRINSLGF